MKLFRGRLGFPRWSFTDGLTKPRRVAERDPNELDEGSEETTQLPRFALTHTAVRGARSALTPSDRRLAAEHGGPQRSLPEGSLATGGIIQPVPSRTRADAPAAGHQSGTARTAAPAEAVQGPAQTEEATTPTTDHAAVTSSPAEPVPDTETTHVIEAVSDAETTHIIEAVTDADAPAQTADATDDDQAEPEATADSALTRPETGTSAEEDEPAEAQARSTLAEQTTDETGPTSQAPAARKDEPGDAPVILGRGAEDVPEAPATVDDAPEDAPAGEAPEQSTAHQQAKPRTSSTTHARPSKSRKRGSATKHLEGLDPEQVNVIEQLREWMESHGDWPVAPTDEAVDLASTSHPDRTYPQPEYGGLPKEPPAVVRAKNGRGFGGTLLNRRRRRKVKPRPPLELDRQRLDEVLTETRESVGEALIDLTVFEARTGLLLASDGGTVATTALWHRASHDLTETLRHADLPRLGGYYLVRLTGGRIAVVVNAHPDLGACLTLDLEQVQLGEVLKHTIPSVRRAVASAAVGASR
ncbi:MAG: hypothetical protein Q4G45_04885 [Actinomycetia bacterium]|nr:hypothetical protein [Actinomycetes bacterium]